MKFLHQDVHGNEDHLLGQHNCRDDKKEQDLTALITELNQKLVELKREEKAADSNRLKYESLVMTYEEKLRELEKAEKEHKKERLKKKEELLRNTVSELNGLLKEARKKSADRAEVRRIRKNVSENLDKTREELRKLTPVPEGEQARGMPGETAVLLADAQRYFADREELLGDDPFPLELLAQQKLISGE